MTTHYKPQWLDRMYNNRALVPEHATHFTRWAALSATTRAQQPCVLDIPFGPEADETLDVFPASTHDGQVGPAAPVVVFIHGGYWRSLDKSEHSFVATPFTRSGACVVIPNYTLCPAITIPGIALQMAKALAWTFHHIREHGGDPTRITVVGHSAGGHLAAMMLSCVWPALDSALPQRLVKNAVSVSGLYDLEPVAHTPFLKESLRLTAQDALRASPAFMPRPRAGVLYAVAGADESPEFLRQNLLIQRAWGKKSVPVCESHLHLNHFSILEALAEPDHRLSRLTRELAHAA